ncbi:2-amino-4-hydroxy-6-hydroxymethyldihydropteridine diphosphokinase [bacterium]|nr:2-amino-4-hydroxy-6-hydroxymethyldihydropteridine diphosphokinase [bacterium]
MPAEPTTAETAASAARPKLAYLGIGSNIGDRLGHLRSAVDSLRAVPGLQVARASQVYRNPPWGFHSETPFLNAVLELRYSGSPWTLLDHLLAIEQAAGRPAADRIPPLRPQSAELAAARLARRLYADRVIDLDLLWFEEAVLTTPLLVLPHPQARKRAFALVPWAELDPEIRLEGETLACWIGRLPESELAALVRIEDTDLLTH